MDKEKFSKQGVRANEAFNIEVIQQQIDPKYKLIRVTASITSETGHLEVFRIEPLQSGLPTFSGRWDRKANTVDVDLIGDEIASQTFITDGTGYHGHHTRVLNDSPHIFQIDIHAPAGRVFTGTITLNIGLGASLTDSFTCQDSAEAVVTPAAKKETPGT